MTFLADTFEKLANDPSWPKGWVCGWQLTAARLALMVVKVESKYWIHEKCVGPCAEDQARHHFGIIPSHYTNVKKRMEEARSRQKTTMIRWILIMVWGWGFSALLPEICLHLILWWTRCYSRC